MFTFTFTFTFMLMFMFIWAGCMGRDWDEVYVIGLMVMEGKYDDFDYCF